MDNENSSFTKNDSIQLVTFRLGSENYAIPVSDVKEIIRPIKTFPVPGMADPVVGVINLRGEIIPVLQVHSVLGVEEEPDSGKSRKKRVIILDSSEGRFGFSVDEVKDVLHVESKDMRKSPEVSSDHSMEDSVLGIVQSASGMLICIDPEKILRQSLDIKELFEECLNV